MSDSFRVLSGGVAGTVFRPPNDTFLAGRSPDAALRFSAQQDPTVSARHAEFSRVDGAWHVRDLGSRNGTYVNGSPVIGRAVLAHGDTIRLGVDGPEIRLDDSETRIAGPAGGSVTQKLRAALRRERMKLRLAGAALLVLLLAAAAVLLSDAQERAGWSRDRSEMQARIDSLLAGSVTTSTPGVVTAPAEEPDAAGLRAAVRESEDRVQQLQDEIASGGSEDTAQDLEQELLSASTALQRQQHAAQLDFPLIQRRNRSAVAMMWVEYSDGTVATGTAFAVRPDGTMLTNRHLIEGQHGGLIPRRVAIRFSDSDQAFPGRVIAVSEGWDLAAVAVENIEGSVPTIARLNTRADTIPVGTPLAMIGFPLGGEPVQSAAGGTRRIARPMVSAALIHRATPSTLELLGVGAAGGSGSPIMDPAGDVIGMLFGGRGEGDEHILMAVPANALIVFLADIR